MNIFFIDKIYQLPAETLSTIEIILRRMHNNSNVFMGDIIFISTLDHTQLKPVKGHPFLLSSHIITNFEMAKIEKFTSYSCKSFIIKNPKYYIFALLSIFRKSESTLWIKRSTSWRS